MTTDVGNRSLRPIRTLPDALDRRDEVGERLRGGPAAVFLDYDGTLTPIVADPDDAELPPLVRDRLARLAEVVPVGILSGRDLEDVRARVGLDELFYAGSHGFDLRGPGGFRRREAEEHLPVLETAEERLRRSLQDVNGARVERKRFAVAIHHRAVPDRLREQVERRVTDVAADVPGLALSRGKKVLELRPDVAWGKGRALRVFLGEMGLAAADARAVYVGDDVTDEDAFGVVAGTGVAIVVRGETDGRPTAADYALEDPAAVGRFLEALTGVLAGSS